MEVTNVNDAGPGSLRAAVEAKGPRTVVFFVSGTIELRSPLIISNDSITIAGQTTPGDGVCLKNYGCRVLANEVIIRYIRARPGDGLVDGKRSGGDAISGQDHKNIIIDHCSMSWGMDETNTFYNVENYTVQWSIISENLYDSFHHKGPHSLGWVVSGVGATAHHNLCAHHDGRNPRFSGTEFYNDSRIVTDFRNNVIYNWGTTCGYGGEGGFFNLVANYYKPGPATPDSLKTRIVQPWGKQGRIGVWYVKDNFVYGSEAATLDNWELGVDLSGGVYREKEFTDEEKIKILAESAFLAPGIMQHTAEETYQLVLEEAGAIYPKRDPVDARLIHEVTTGTAQFGATYGGGGKGIIDSPEEVGGWPELRTYHVLEDTDHDGMPDIWEIEHGLDIKDPKDRNGIIDPEEPYTNLEKYLAEIAENGPIVNEE